MPKYLVRWPVEIEADSPEEAVYRACDVFIERNRSSIVLDVLGENEEFIESIELVVTRQRNH